LAGGAGVPGRGGIYLALPSSLIVGPIWLLPTTIVVLLVPTVIAHHTGRSSLNRILGLIAQRHHDHWR